MKKLFTIIALCLFSTAAFAGSTWTVDMTDEPLDVGQGTWTQIPESTTAKGDEFIIQDRTGNAKIECRWDGNTSAANGLAILPGRSLGVRATVIPSLGVIVKVTADSTTNAAQVDFVLFNSGF